MAINLGKQGERWAEQFLKKQGFNIEARNYRTVFGEIDLVVRRQHQLVFVEVKTRSSTAFGSGEEAITTEKKKRLTMAALHYLKCRGHPNDEPIFGVVAVGFEAGQFSGALPLGAFEAEWGDG